MVGGGMRRNCRACELLSATRPIYRCLPPVGMPSCRARCDVGDGPAYALRGASVGSWLHCHPLHAGDWGRASILLTGPDGAPYFEPDGSLWWVVVHAPGACVSRAGVGELAVDLLDRGSQWRGSVGGWCRT